ncbi:MAG: acyl-CoA synthetase [Sporichthyaceae bacterium]
MLPALFTGYDGPDSISIGGRQCSFADLACAAAAMAARIRGMPMVAVEAIPTPSTLVAVVGALAAGTPLVPIAPDAGTLEVEHIISDAGVTYVLGQPDWGAGRLCVPIPFPGSPMARGGRLDPNALPAPLVLYTSGTTGSPKGVVLSPHAIADNIDALADAWDWTAEDTLVHGLPLFHVHGLILGVLGVLRTGSRLVHTGSATPEAYGKAAALGGSLFFGVPTIWSRLCSEPDQAKRLRHARLLVSGSAALSAATFTDLQALTGLTPVERYGMTETLITVGSRADGERRPGEVGTPLRDVHTRLVDDAGDPVPADGTSVGELQVRCPTMFDGYLGRPEATAACWSEDGWFRTGDLAAIGADGWHRIVGRASVDMIKSGGFRIGAGEIEVALLAHPAVHEAAVIGEPDGDLGQRIVAYVVADEVSADELMVFVAEGLSAHKRPRRIEFRTELPRNALGKVQKGKLTDA